MDLKSAAVKQGQALYRVARSLIWEIRLALPMRAACLARPRADRMKAVPVSPMDRIAQPCCAAGFQFGLCRLGVKSTHYRAAALLSASISRPQQGGFIATLCACHKRTHAPQQKSSLNHLVSELLKTQRHVKAERFGSPAGAWPLQPGFCYPAPLPSRKRSRCLWSQVRKSWQYFSKHNE